MDLALDAAGGLLSLAGGAVCVCGFCVSCDEAATCYYLLLDVSILDGV